MEDRVITEITDRVAHVRLNRPAKKNGLDLALFMALVDAGVDLMERKDVRAVVLSGEGGCFSAGLDFKAFMAGGRSLAAKLLDRGDGDANLAQRVAWVWQELQIPVIAAIEGVAFGGGMQIAAGADIRYAAPDARFSVMEIKWGIIPDMGITRTLATQVRPDVLRELVWTGRIVEAQEALALGLVTRVCDDPVAAALELAGQLTQKNPDAVRRSKGLLQQAPSLELRAALELESDLQRQLLGTPNQLEAVMANFQNRPPAFKDPA